MRYNLAPLIGVYHESEYTYKAQTNNNETRHRKEWTKINPFAAKGEYD